MQRTDEQKRTYLSEIAIALKRVGFTVQAEENGLLPVKWNGQPLCRVNADGTVRYDSQAVSDFALDDVLSKAISETRTVTEYMDFMEQAPGLKANGLEDSFKLLGEFNHVVLAGRMTRFGANFVTWTREHGSLSGGHYFMENYEGAKRDFAIRAGLVPKEQIFTQEQLAELYRSIHETLENEYPITDARRELLESAAVQIENGVSDLEQRVAKSQRAEREMREEVIDHGQTFMSL